MAIRRRLPAPPRNLHLLRQVRLGDEIEVWWPHDERYYPGHVQAILPSGRHRIYYTDGEKEELLLETEQWRFRGAAATRVLDANANANNIYSPHNMNITYTNYHHNNNTNNTNNPVEIIELDRESSPPHEREGEHVERRVEPHSEKGVRKDVRAVTDTSAPQLVLPLRIARPSSQQASTERRRRTASSASSALHPETTPVVKRRRASEGPVASRVKHELKHEHRKRAASGSVDMIVLDDEPRKRKPVERRMPVSTTVSTTPVKASERNVSAKGSPVPRARNANRGRGAANTTITVHTSVRKMGSVVEESAGISGRVIVKKGTSMSKPNRSNVITSSSTDRRSSFPSRSNHIESVHAHSVVKPSTKTPSKPHLMSRTPKRNPFTVAPTKSPMDVNSLLNRASLSPIRRHAGEERKRERSKSLDGGMRDSVAAPKMKGSEGVRLSSSASPVTPAPRAVPAGKGNAHAGAKEDVVIGIEEKKRAVVKLASQRTRPSTTEIASTKVDNSSKCQANVRPFKMSASVATTGTSPAVVKPIMKPASEPELAPTLKPESKSARATTSKATLEPSVVTPPKSDKPKPAEAPAAKASTPAFSSNKDTDMKDVAAHVERRRQVVKRKMAAVSDVQAKRPRTEVNNVSPSAVVSKATSTFQKPVNMNTLTDSKKADVPMATGTPTDNATPKSAKRNTAPEASKDQCQEASDALSDMNAPKPPTSARGKDSSRQREPVSSRKGAIVSFLKAEEGLSKKLITPDSRSMAETAGARGPPVVSSSRPKELVVTPPPSISRSTLGITSTKTKALLPTPLVIRDSQEKKKDVTRLVTTTLVAGSKVEGSKRAKPVPSTFYALTAIVKKNPEEQADVPMADATDSAARFSGNAVVASSSRTQVQPHTIQIRNMVGKGNSSFHEHDTTTLTPKGTTKSNLLVYSKAVNSQSILQYPRINDTAPRKSAPIVTPTNNCVYAGSNSTGTIGAGNGINGNPLRRGISKSRVGARVSQDKKKGTASLPLNVLMDTIKESNLRGLQNQIQPLTKRVEKLFSETKAEFIKLHDRIDKFDERMERSAKQNEILVNEIAELRRSLQHVPKQGSFESLVMRSLDQVQTKIFEDVRKQSDVMERKLKRSLASGLETSIKRMGMEIQMDSAMVIKKAIDSAVNNMGIELENGNTLQSSEAGGSNTLEKGNTNED